jgi:hypothetical protein
VPGVFTDSSPLGLFEIGTSDVRSCVKSICFLRLSAMNGP